MKSRCANKNHPRYKDWGGRGIHYDERWETFENFLADMGEKPEGLQLDRIDNDDHYYWANCRWVTPKVNSNNRRNTKETV
jgi:hypothetical protein